MLTPKKVPPNGQLVQRITTRTGANLYRIEDATPGIALHEQLRETLF